MAMLICFDKMLIVVTIQISTIKTWFSNDFEGMSLPIIGCTIISMAKNNVVCNFFRLCTGSY